MKKFNLYTPVKKQRRVRLEKVIYATLDWCIDKWGLKDHNYELILDVSYKEHMVTGESDKAEYDPTHNEIVIFPSQHSNIRDLIDSVIHEFTHQRQDLSNYFEILNKRGYSNHPLEIEAFEVAKKNRTLCWKDIKKIINNEKKS